MDLATLSAARQARLIRRRTVSAHEVVRATLGRIDALNGRLEAFTGVHDERALAAARAADAAVRDGSPLGPLHGVPVALKDLYDDAGVVNSAGSRVLEENVPSRDATTVAALKRAGAIIVGRTQLSEFAIGATVFGQMRNPWDTARLAGASSGGSGAAVAARLCPVAMGSDTGGSIRIPASFSGVVGLKPTYGRVSRAGIIPLDWSLDTAGPLANTVEDAAIVLSAIAGYDNRDPASADRPVENYLRGLRRGVRGLRIGVPKEWFYGLMDSDVRQAVRKGLAVLKGLGATSRSVSIPMVAHCLEIGSIIQWAEAAAYHAEWMDDRPQKYGPGLLNRLRAGRFIMAADFVRAQRLRKIERSQFLQALSRVDVLITPTTPITAPMLDQTEYRVDGTTPADRTYAIAAFTIPINHAGLPAVSVPCGFTKTGLPIGMQIVGRPFDEATILRAAYAFERATDWHNRMPPAS